jgi:hypothetical protein
VGTGASSARTTSCPVACYLHATVAPRATVEASFVEQPLAEFDEDYRVSLPGPVQAFIRAFDDGGYSDLLLADAGVR